MRSHFTADTTLNMNMYWRTHYKYGFRCDFTAIVTPNITETLTHNRQLITSSVLTTKLASGLTLQHHTQLCCSPIAVNLTPSLVWREHCLSWAGPGWDIPLWRSTQENMGHNRKWRSLPIVSIKIWLALLFRLKTCLVEEDLYICRKTDQCKWLRTWKVNFSQMLRKEEESWETLWLLSSHLTCTLFCTSFLTINLSKS